MFYYELTRPFAYLAIKHPAKWKLDWLLPSIFSIIITLVLFAIVYHSQKPISFFSKDGIASYLLSFIQTLPGFYIAALAAIAAFGGSNLDRTFPNECPTIMQKYLGEKTEIELTRRRYLAILFAYLTILSIILTLTTITLINIGSFFYNLMIIKYQIYTNLLLIFLYILFIFQLIFVTFHSLYYLGDKIYDPSDD